MPIRSLVVALLLFALVPAVATAAPPGGLVVTHFYTFAPGDRLEEFGVDGPPVLLVAGTELWYANLDGAAHSVSAVDARDGVPLFDSGLLSLGEAAPVAGTATLTPGDYSFVCSIHPFLMQGTLRIVG